MADPLGIIAIIITLLETTAATINYLKDVRGAPEGHRDFLVEIAGLQALLLALQARVKQALSGDRWFAAVETLGVQGGPFDQLRSDLDRLKSRLGPVSGLKDIGRRLTWPFTKAEIKEVLFKVERIKTLASLALADDLFSLAQAIKEDLLETKVKITMIEAGVADIKANQDEEEYRKIADWLSPLDFRTTQSEVFQKRTDGTGQWLLDSKEFTDWHKGTSKNLWCSGMPGAGKTVLTSTVVKYLQTFFKDDNVAIACIYCNYKEQKAQTVVNLAASLLKQIARAHHTTFDNIRSLYKHHTSQKTHPELDEIMTALVSEIVTYQKVFIVIDALDECREDNGTRAEFLGALCSLSGTVNLMVTSRDHFPAGGDLQGTKHLYIRANDQDIRSYIAQRITCAPRRHLKEKQLQEMIMNKVVKNADGMFLLAQLHMDALVAKPNPAAVYRALENLPRGLDDTYKEAMERIEQQTEDGGELAKQIFSWLTYACRPLSVKELQHALAVKPSMTNMDLDEITDEDILTSVCAGLVVIDEEHSVIHLVHYTTQQYFENMQEALFPHAQASIAVTCLTYLSFDVFERGYCHNDPDLESLLEANPLLDYAAHHWGDHAHGQMGENVKRVAQKLLHNHSKIACVSQVLLSHQGYQFAGYSQRFPKGFSGVHMSSFFGLEQFLEYQLDNGAEPDLKDSDGQTPLSWTAQNGHEKVVQLLVARDDVEADSKDNYGQTPLSCAATFGRTKVVQLLVVRGDVQVDSRDKDGRTPLSWAAGNGRGEVARLLVARNDVDVESRDNDGRTPLSWAAGNGQEEVVRLLAMRDDVEVNSRDNNGRTPLSWAAEDGREEVVRLLAAQDGIEVESKDNNGRTPLSWAAGNGREEVVRLLVARDDVEADSKDNHSRTPLSWAAENGRGDVVRLLVMRDDVETDSKDHHGRTPLSCAAVFGRTEVVRLLVVRDDVKADSKDNYGQTPLSCAAAFGRMDVVRLLVERDDVKADSKETYGQTPLSCAAAFGRTEMVRLLAARDDVDVESKDNDGRTPLSWAAGNGREEAVRLFIARNDVQADSKDNDGRTPLSWAAEYNAEKVVRLLVARDDVNVESKDNHGRTPLSWAAENGSTEIVRLLVARDDVQADSKDKYGQTPLSCAAAFGRIDVVRLLVERDDVEADSKETYGQTPLSCAAAFGRTEVVRLLASRDDVDVGTKDNDGRTPLSWAAGNGREEVVRLLVARDDVEADSKDNEGRTPLSWAAEYDGEEVVRLLAARDDVNVVSKDNYGRTPLYWAAKNGRDEEMRLACGM